MATTHREYVRAISLHHDVVVLDAPREESPGAHRLFRVERVTEDGVRIVRVRFRRSPVPKTSLLLHLLAVLVAGRTIVRDGFRPDLVHGRYYFIALAAGALGRFLGVPVVLAEGSECYAVGLPWRIRQEARFAMRLADVLIPASESLRVLMEQYGIRGDFRVIPNPVDTSLFLPSPGVRARGGTRRLLTVARQVPVKGFPTLLEALARLCRVRDDVVLDVVGDGFAYATNRTLARQLGIEGHVTFHGFRPRQAVAELMRRADLFVLSSLSENCPSVLIEALASGLPVVATDIEGVREVVPKDMGVFFPREDPQALAEALAWTLNHVGNYDPWEMARYAQLNFGLEAIGRRLDTVYREVLAGR